MRGMIVAGVVVLAGWCWRWSGGGVGGRRGGGRRRGRRPISGGTTFGEAWAINALGTQPKAAVTDAGWEVGRAAVAGARAPKLLAVASITRLAPGWCWGRSGGGG